MTTAFAVVFPLGTAVARYLKRLAPKALAGTSGRRAGDNWLTQHSWIQSAGTLLIAPRSFVSVFRAGIASGLAAQAAGRDVGGVRTVCAASTGRRNP